MAGARPRQPRCGQASRRARSPTECASSRLRRRAGSRVACSSAPALRPSSAELRGVRLDCARPPRLVPSRAPLPRGAPTATRSRGLWRDARVAPGRASPRLRSRSPHAEAAAGRRRAARGRARRGRRRPRAARAARPPPVGARPSRRRPRRRAPQPAPPRRPTAPADRGRARPRPAHRQGHPRRQPPRRVRGHRRLPVADAPGQDLHARGPRARTSASSGTRASSRTSRSTSRRNDDGVVPALPRARAAEHQGDRVRGQRRSSTTTTSPRRSASRSRPAPSSAYAADPPRRPEAQRQVRRGGLLPRRGRLRGRSRSKENQVIVKFTIEEHEPVTRPAHHLHRQRPRPRRRAARGDADRAAASFSRLRLRRPVPPGRRSSATSCVLNALYYDKGYLTRADRHAAGDAHARPRGHRDHDRDQRGAPLQDPPAPHLRAATTTARRSSRSAAGAHLREMVRAQVGRLLQPRRARQGPRRRPDALPRRRLRERRGRAARPSSTRSTRRSTSSCRSSASHLVYFGASRSRATPRRATR